MDERAWSGYQRAIFAFIAEKTRHLVCQAYAGSGKTTTAVGAVQHVPGGGSIGMTAFNTDIAAELKTRVRGVSVRTFNGFGHVAVARKYNTPSFRLEVDRYNDDKICREFGVDYLTRVAAVKLVKWCKDSLLVREEIPPAVREEDGIYGRMSALADEAGIDVPAGSGIERNAFFDLVLDVIDAARDPRRRGTISFDDQVWLTLVNNYPLEDFDVLFVDEAQDMNNSQLALALKMQREGGRIVVFGDTHQAIYGFRGAHDDAMFWLAKTLKAETLDLPICYRSSRAVVRYAQEFVPGIQPADGAEDGLVAEASLGQMFAHAEPKDFILSRSNAGAVSACLTLLARGKAAKLRGRPKFGLDLANLVQNSKCTYCEQFRVFITDWKSREIARCVKEERDPQLVTDKADCLMLLSEGLDTVQELIDKIAILFREDAPGVTCSTIHGAKGMETDRVWLLGQSFKGCHYYAAKGLRESTDTLAHQFSCKRVREENNITYVAITRAKRELYCVEGVPRRLG